MISLDRTKTWTAAKSFPFTSAVAQGITHELTHLLLFPQVAKGPGWNSAEHVKDPDGDGDETIGDTGDRPYLMYKGSTLENQSTIKFSDLTIGEINVSGKDGTHP